MVIKSARRRSLLNAGAAALALSALFTGSLAAAEPGQPPALQGGRQVMEPPGQVSVRIPEDSPQPAWKDIRDFEAGRAAGGHPLPAQTSNLMCPAPGSCRQEFGSETVLWSPETGALALHKTVEALSGRADFTYLGHPKSSEYEIGTAFRTDFDNGSLIRIPELNRIMTWDAAVAESAVVIGDSQTGPDTWVDQGLTALGYRTVLRGAGGTGYNTGNGSVGSYYTALTQQQWLLPWGNPKLVVLQGGGNDANSSSDADITRAAGEMIKEVRRTYPHSHLVMVGVISSGKGTGGSRRTAVDTLLAGVAKQQGVEFLSVGDWWTQFGLGNDLRPDGRHFTAAGHQKAGAVLARELGAMLISGTAREALSSSASTAPSASPVP